MKSLYLEAGHLNKWRENSSTSIFRHSGNCLHDADKIVFIVTEFSKHIKQATSHDLPIEQERLGLVDGLAIPAINADTFNSNTQQMSAVGGLKEELNSKCSKCRKAQNKKATNNDNASTENGR